MAKGIDLSKLALEELQGLARDVEAEIVARREAERERVLAQMRELAGSIGMSLEELVGQEKGRGRGARAAARYRHPDDPSLTWSGRGKRPVWLNEALESGKSLEDFAIELP